MVMINLISMTDNIVLHQEQSDSEWGSLSPRKAIPKKVNGHLRYNTTFQKIATATGNEVVFTATILLPVGVELNYQTQITFTDFQGNTYTRKPLNIAHKRDIGGKPILIKVVI